MLIEEKKLRSLLNQEIALIVLDSVDSTQSYLKRLKPIKPTVVIASAQEKGYGTRSRVFYSPKQSGLYLSFYLPLKYQDHQLTMNSAVVLVDVLKDFSNRDLKIKWFNDIYANCKKAIGILVESILDENNQITGYILGLGMNLFEVEKTKDDELNKKLGFLFDKKNLAIETILSIILNRIYFEYQNNIFDITLYNQYLMFKDQEILIKTDLNPRLVKVLEVDKKGLLVVKEQGQIYKYQREQVELIKF